MELLAVGILVCALVSSAADNDGMFERFEVAADEWKPRESHKHDSVIKVSAKICFCCQLLFKTGFLIFSAEVTAWH